MYFEGRNLTAGYGSGAILHDISITVGEGEIVSIIGPNGAGKSTLLKTLFGFLTPTSGEIQFEDVDLTSTSPESMADHGVCYVFQRDNVFSGMTVRENLEMAAYTRPETVTDRLETVYELFPVLRERTGQTAGSLSGGEQQMLALACGLMLDPSILLIDEPTAALAPQLIGAVFDKLEAINNHGTTLLLVEQNVEQVLQISDRVYVLENGRNRFTGSPDELADDEELMQLYLGAG